MTPTVNALAALLGGVDGPLRSHLRLALTEYADQCRRQERKPVPPEFAVLIESLRRPRAASSGQPGTGCGGLADAEPVQPDALDYRTAADRLSVSDRTVRRLVKQGDLPAVDIGGCRRIRSSDLTAFLDGLQPDGDTPDE